MAAPRGRLLRLLFVVAGLFCLLAASQIAATARRDLFPKDDPNLFAALNEAALNGRSNDQGGVQEQDGTTDVGDEIIGSLAAGLAAASSQALAAAASVNCGLGPVLCKTLDCPTYKVLEDYDGTELRRYDPATFTSTLLSLDEEGSIEKSAIVGFHRLLKYNLGDNEDSQKVGMTAPVLYGLDVDRKASSRRQVVWRDRFSVSFFVPFKYQEEPPSPSNPDVFLVDVKEKDIFVRSFGGYATGARINHIASEFLRDLYDDGHRVDCRTVYIAQYSPPFQPVFRYNEVWVLRAPKRRPDDAATAAAGGGDEADSGFDAGDDACAWLAASNDAVDDVEVAAAQEEGEVVGTEVPPS